MGRATGKSAASGIDTVRKLHGSESLSNQQILDKLSLLEEEYRWEATDSDTEEFLWSFDRNDVTSVLVNV